MSIKLGKTKDSRTRRKQAAIENVSLVETLKSELAHYTNYLDYLLAKGHSSLTAKRYIKDVVCFKKWLTGENLPEEAVGYNDVLGYIRNLKHLKRNTVAKQVLAIRHYYGYLMQREIVAENPADNITVKGIKRRVLYDILSKEELESLYHNFGLPDQENDPNKNQNWFKTFLLAGKRNKVILGLMIYQGLGSTELARLSEKDVKLREGKIYIAGSRRSNERTLKLEAHQVMDMMEYTLKTRGDILTLVGKQSERLFVSAGESDRFNNIMQKFIKNLREQDSKVTSAKQIRTSVITHWLKIYNLRQVQYMAGHRYVSSTEAYLINDMDDLQEDINNYHPIG